MASDVVVRVLGLTFGVALGACAGREFPATHPEASAASPSAAAAAPAHVTVALQQDPPLPGESTEGWPGLQPPAAGHAEHGQAQGHEEHEHTHGAASEAVYVCPMHPEVTSDQPGTCSKCGMPLVKKP